MMKKVMGISLILLAFTLFVMTIKTTEKVGISNKMLAAPSGSVIHTGTSGGVTWEIYENGHLLFKPTNGVEGTFDDMYFDVNFNYAWHQYKDIVKSISFSPGVKTSGILMGMFNGFSEVTDLDLNGLDTSNALQMNDMFEVMSSLTKLDFSREKSIT